MNEQGNSTQDMGVMKTLATMEATQKQQDATMKQLIAMTSKMTETIGDLTTEIRVSNNNHAKVEEDIRELKKQCAKNKERHDLIQGNIKMLQLIIGAVVTSVITIGIKSFGG